MSKLLKGNMFAPVGWALLVVAGSMSLACAADGTPSDPIVIQMISGTLNSAEEPIVRKHWEKIGEETKGRIEVSIHTRDELGLDGPSVMRAAKLGVQNITVSPLAFSGGEIPQNDGLDVQGLIPNLEIGLKVADAWFPYVAKAHSDIGVELVGVFPIVGQMIWCAAPISGLDDLKGKKIRVSGASLSALMTGVGAVPSPIAFPEVVSSLQRLVIDCAVTGSVSGNVANWPEVTTHLYPLITGWSFQGIYANKAWWDGLPPDARDLIKARWDQTVDDAWVEARKLTDAGIWCSVGDSRCNVDAGGQRMNKASMHLVPVSAEDQKRLQEAAISNVLPAFAARCGAPCAEACNATVAPALGISGIAQ